MIRSLYIAATGMDAQQTNIDVISNNLANVNTNSYKKGRADFQDLMYQELKAVGSATGNGTSMPTGLLMGSGVRTAAVGKLHTVGDFKNTSGELDLAIEGNGYFEITLPDGSTGFTRDGSFKRSGDGIIVTSEGYPLSPGITIPAEALQITIGSDGTVSAVIASTVATTELGVVNISGFANPSGLKSVGKNLYTETSASGTPTSGRPGENGLGTIAQGFLESSNVNIAEELVDMIIAQRAYEINSKAIQSADEMLQLANNLKR